ncbi:HlyD family efflux transporter periplasmic adaptor subunit [Psychrobacter sp. YGAH215]|uniref:efflux RND transporter periplasmic adaptor subunit n=1 Tax=Psychrobacter sp. YGAH215 TaxID=2596826 RepID=UPI00118583F5|nr:HlyD family efflux transporter periplasmic adaptor subunit [Psychrobacter sp. YGAH215]TSB24221.1 HlyD family efflux transporter periplasmic adaptor subunit [Psychrobacter sp. YGAH215]
MTGFIDLRRLKAKFSSTILLAFSPLKKGAYLLGAALLIACQPSPPTSEPVTAENSEAFDTPLLIRADSITMTPDHILSVKPTRYQPSLGLEGEIEPIKQVNLIAAQALTVEQVWVKINQRVEKGAPLFTVRRQAAPIDSTESSEQADDEVATSLEVEDEVADNKGAATEPKPSAINSTQAAPKDSTAKNSDNIKPSAEKNGEDDKENFANASRHDLDNNQASKHTETANNLITVRASFAGHIEKLYVKSGQQVAPRQPLLKLSDGTELHFSASLPIEAKSQISVGQTVNFTAEGLIDKFTGQVSKLTITELPKQLLVYVNVVDNEVSRNQIRPDMQVTGRVDYGQIEVGTIVPKRALHNVDLTVLHKPPYKPLRPLHANVWIIKQDQRLTRQPVEVIEYDPLTKQYLIAGITNDSLICLANLPVESEGKKAVVS